MRFDIQYANGSEDEPRSEYEGKIEYAGFENPHDGLLPELLNVQCSTKREKLKIQDFKKKGECC
jgi:hypothetical protein